MFYLFLLLLQTSILFSMQETSVQLFESVKKMTICPEQAANEIEELLLLNVNPTVTNENHKTAIHILMDLHTQLLHDYNKLETLSTNQISDETIETYKNKHYIYQKIANQLIEKGLEFDDMFITYDTDTTDSILAMQSYIKKNYSHIIGIFNAQT